MDAAPQGAKVAGYAAGEDWVVTMASLTNNRAQARRLQKSFKTTRRRNFHVASFRRRSFRVKRPSFRIADHDAAVGRRSPFGQRDGRIYAHDDCVWSHCCYYKSHCFTPRLTAKPSRELHPTPASRRAARTRTRGLGEQGDAHGDDEHERDGHCNSRETDCPAFSENSLRHGPGAIHHVCARSSGDDWPNLLPHGERPQSV